MSINSLSIKLYLFGITLLICACGADKKNRNIETTGNHSNAYMSNNEWKEYNERNKNMSEHIVVSESVNCLPTKVDELLELFKSPMRHEWLSNNNFNLVKTTGTEKTRNYGDNGKDSTQQFNLWYQRCVVESDDATWNKDGGKIFLKANPLEFIRYTISYKDFSNANQQFKILKEEYKKKYKEVKCQPTGINKYPGRSIFFVDDIFIFLFLHNGHSSNSITLSKEPIAFMKSWKNDWRAGLYQIDGNPYKLKTVKNTVPESIDGKDVHNTWLRIKTQ